MIFLPSKSTFIKSISSLAASLVFASAVPAHAQDAASAVNTPAATVAPVIVPVGELASVPAPALGARAWLSLDMNSGQIISGHNLDERIEPASLTKIMAAYLVFEALEASV